MADGDRTGQGRSGGGLETAKATGPDCDELRIGKPKGSRVASGVLGGAAQAASHGCSSCGKIRAVLRSRRKVRTASPESLAAFHFGPLDSWTTRNLLGKMASGGVSEKSQRACHSVTSHGSAHYDESIQRFDFIDC
jgi:hypothetical protein